MTRRERSGSLFALLALVLAGGCSSSSADPETGGHTNWLTCVQVDDCPVPQAVDCEHGYCLDYEGERIVAESDAGLPADWIEVDASCGYRFQAPPDVREETVQGEDSCVDRYVTAACQYTGGYGMYATSYAEFTGHPGFMALTQPIDGLTATLMTGRFEMPEDGRAYFAVADFERDGAELYLTMFATCTTREGQREATAVLNSIIRPRP